MIVVSYIKLRWDFNAAFLFHDALLYDGNQNTASYKYT